MKLLYVYANFEQVNKYIINNDSHFFLSEKDVTNKKRGKVRINLAMLVELEVSVWTHGFKYIQINRYRKKHRYVYMHVTAYKHVLPSSISWEGLGAMTPQEQWAHLGAGTWCLNTIFQRRELGLQGGIAASKGKAGKIEDDPETSCGARKWGSTQKLLEVH